MKKLKILFLASMGLLSLNSCETTELNQTDDSNAQIPLQAEVDYLINNIQISFAKTVNTFGDLGSEPTRIEYMHGGGGTYNTAYSDLNFNDVWAAVYQGVVKDIRTMNSLADELDLTKHIGVGQVLEAYLMLTLVDYFGDVPYSEAFDESNLNPILDSGSDIYTLVLTMLDDAIANFQSDSAELELDLYYDGNYSNWIKLANTLKMKAYIQTRLVDNNAIANFQNIVNSGNYITSNSENFAFDWANGGFEPNLLHPGYVENYQSLRSGYSSTWLMNLMMNDKSIKDPRIRYYFYRQRAELPSDPGTQWALISCGVLPIPAHYLAIGSAYCYPGYPHTTDAEGYWGRDHGNNKGFPPDIHYKTAKGLYPVGGRFDDDTFQTVSNNISLGAHGAGVTPIIMSSTVDFWRAEAALFGGSGNAAAHLANGIEKSIEYVRGFINRHVAEFDNTFIPSTSYDDTYITEASANMNAASSTADKLDVLAKEFFVALYGNGVDAFNFYRRTGAPRDIQLHLESSPGGFIRSHYYPAIEVNNNANVSQKPDVTTRVFWDTNPLEGFPQNN